MDLIKYLIRQFIRRERILPICTVSVRDAAKPCLPLTVTGKTNVSKEGNISK